MKKSMLRASLALPAAALLAVAAGCSSGKSSSAPSSSSPPAPSSSSSGAPSSGAPGATASSVSTGSATVSGAAKTVLVAQDGKTLYYFTPDSAGGQPTCVAACATLWPPLTVAAPTAGSGVTGKLAVVMGGNGDQVTYNGHPLYEYAKDTATGQATGEGVGGKWHVATPDLAGGTQPSTGGSSSGPGGYGNG
jgi:predicted lipoprotein with Yx(FWY)xxD motif